MNEEEAARVEAEDEERYARAQSAAKEAIARRQDVRTEEPGRAIRAPWLAPAPR